MNQVDISKFEDALLKAFRLLQRYGQPDWEKHIYRIGGMLQDNPWDCANEFLRIYGGVGGFGEVYFSVNGVPLYSENIAMETLKDELYALARSIKDKGP